MLYAFNLKQNVATDAMIRNTATFLNPALFGFFPDVYELYVLSECFAEYLQCSPYMDKRTPSLERCHNPIKRTPCRNRDPCCAGHAPESRNHFISSIINDMSQNVIQKPLNYNPPDSIFTIFAFARIRTEQIGSGPHANKETAWTGLIRSTPL